MDNDTLNDVRIEYFLRALTALQHPLYYKLSLYLNESNELLKSLEHVNITELMIKVTTRLYIYIFYIKKISVNSTIIL